MKSNAKASRLGIVGILLGMALSLAWPLTAQATVTASGGNATNDFGGSRYHVFTNTGSAVFDVTAGGSVDVLIVGGGGGGRDGGALGLGGGGAGGLLLTNATVQSGSNYTISVGAGGTNTTDDWGESGEDSVALEFVAFGGGGGARAGYDGATGGSGGGGGAGFAGNYDEGDGGSSTNGQGSAGGSGSTDSTNGAGGGGGGYGTPGSNAVVQAGGMGGQGIDLSGWLNGLELGDDGWFVGGGGGGRRTAGAVAAGGKGGGGAGAGSATVGQDGMPNTGGGAGGGGGDTEGLRGAGKGGSGVVVVRYLLSQDLSVIANAATGIGTTNATLNGQVGGTGGEPDPDVYFCWGPEDGGTESTGAWHRVVSMGTREAGEFFSHELFELNMGQEYFIRVYATNSAGQSAWSDLQEFTTFDLPTIVLESVTDIGRTIARINGEVTDTGGQTPWVGLKYWPQPAGEPEISIQGAQEDGVFDLMVSGLEPDTTYGVQLWGSNVAGKVFSTSTESFTTADTTPVSYTFVGTTDNDWYKTNNWSPAGIPGLGDGVTIIGYTVEIDGSVQSELEIETLTLGPTSGTVAGRLAGVNTPPTLTVNGAIAWRRNAGTTGSGKIVARSGILFDELSFFGGHQTSSWDIDFEADSTYRMYPYDRSDGRTLNNSGTWNIFPGVTFTIDGSARHITGSGTINLSTNAVLRRQHHSFANHTRIDNEVNLDHATVEVIGSAGGLRLEGSGTSCEDSQYVVADNRNIHFAGGHTVYAAFDWGTNASLTFRGGSLHSPVSTPGNLIKQLTTGNGAVFSGPDGSYDTTEDVRVEEGGATFDSALEVGRHLITASTTQDGSRLDGSKDILVHGNFYWQSANGPRRELLGSGTVTIMGDLLLGTARFARWNWIHAGRTLIIHGNTDYNLYPFDHDNPTDGGADTVYIFRLDGTLINKSGAVWSFVNSSLRPIRSSPGNTGLFINEAGATFQKITGAHSRGIKIYPEITFTNAGLVRCTSGPLYFNGPFLNTGTVSAEDIGILSFGDTYTQTAGVLQGTGTVAGAATLNIDGGRIEPGLPTGQLTVSAPIAMSAGAAIRIHISGTDPETGFGRLAAGTLDLNGCALDVVWLDDFKPDPADEFTVITASNLSGQFGNLTPRNRVMLEHGGWYEVQVSPGAGGSVVLKNYGFPAGSMMLVK